MGQSLSASGIGESCEASAAIGQPPPVVAGEVSEPVVQVADTRQPRDAKRSSAADLVGKVKEYLIAARRKVQIAEYHLGCLRLALAASERPDEPSVPVQAHFEVVLYSGPINLVRILLDRLRWSTATRWPVAWGDPA